MECVVGAVRHRIAFHCLSDSHMADVIGASRNDCLSVLIVGNNVFHRPAFPCFFFLFLCLTITGDVAAC